MRQILHPVSQLLLLIEVPEKPGVVEAGPQNALVALPYQTFRIAVRIHHRDEMRRQGMRRRLDGKILLVTVHHRREHFRGQVQVCGIEISPDRGRVFSDIR